ncbi:MAG: ribonuclease PH, partial [Proteobacteria bacterium]|nr:ribonuclease PH [Pseudomonadota bacterium]
EVVLDLDYAEDSNAAADANFVIMDKGGLVEVQATAEDRAFSEEQFAAMLGFARKGIGELVAAQRQALGLESGG